MYSSDLSGVFARISSRSVYAPENSGDEAAKRRAQSTKYPSVSPRPTCFARPTAVPNSERTPHCNLGHGNCANTLCVNVENVKIVKNETTNTGTSRYVDLRDDARLCRTLDHKIPFERNSFWCFSQAVVARVSLDWYYWTSGREERADWRRLPRASRRSTLHPPRVPIGAIATTSRRGAALRGLGGKQSVCAYDCLPSLRFIPPSPRRPSTATARLATHAGSTCFLHILHTKPLGHHGTFVDLGATKIRRIYECKIASRIARHASSQFAPRRAGNSEQKLLNRYKRSISNKKILIKNKTRN